MDISWDFRAFMSMKGQFLIMNWRADRPFNDLPLLPPALEQLETRRVLKACIGARAGVAELKQAGALLPDPGLLIHLLPVLEARDSSEIENILTTSDRLFRHAQQESLADPMTREALCYRDALLKGYHQLSARPLSTATAVEVCSIIKNRPMDIRKVPGTAIGSSKTGDVIYTPPEGEQRLRDLLANWERFVHAEDDMDPLIRMAVAHYQFEAIHPFTDGNGRTGRILNVLFLVERGLLTLPILHLSRYLVATKADYYRLLLKVTREDEWEDWIVYILQGIEQVAGWTCARIVAVKELMDQTASYVKARLPRIYSHELMQVIFEQPFCRIASLVERDIAKRQTASVYLQQLVDIGVLDEQKVGREKLFAHPRLIALMSSDDHDFKPYPNA